jgi:hypothetical protein
VPKPRLCISVINTDDIYFIHSIEMWFYCQTSISFLSVFWFFFFTDVLLVLFAVLCP